MKETRETGESCAGCMHARMGFNLIECRLTNTVVNGMSWCPHYDVDSEDDFDFDDYDEEVL